MKKNIIFDKNFLNENGVNVNSINATNIIVETVTQTGDLSIDGNLTISNNLDINGTVLNTSSNELNVNTTINTTGNVNIGKYVTSELYNGSSGTFNIQVTTFGTPIYTNGMDGITSSNSGLQIGWNNTSFYGETDFLNWGQQGLGLIKSIVSLTIGKILSLILLSEVALKLVAVILPDTVKLPLISTFPVNELLPVKIFPF